MDHITPVVDQTSTCIVQNCRNEATIRPLFIIIKAPLTIKQWGGVDHRCRCELKTAEGECRLEFTEQREHTCVLNLNFNANSLIEITKLIHIDEEKHFNGNIKIIHSVSFHIVAFFSHMDTAVQMNAFNKVCPWVMALMSLFHSWKTSRKLNHVLKLL